MRVITIEKGKKLAAKEVLDFLVPPNSSKAVPAAGQVLLELDGVERFDHFGLPRFSVDRLTVVCPFRVREGEGRVTVTCEAVGLGSDEFVGRALCGNCYDDWRVGTALEMSSILADQVNRLVDECLPRGE